MVGCLSGRAAVITGGNGGIGFAIAEAFVAEGARVLLVGRDEAKMTAAQARLGQSAAVLAGDIVAPGIPEAAVGRAVALYGRLDILVNNAGMSIRKLPEDLDDEDWNMVLDTNLTASFRFARAALPAFTRAGGGKVLNIGSMLSLFGLPFAAAYAASKGGIVQLTKSLATAWARHNIQVNAILPGWIDSDLTRAARREYDELHGNVVKRTPAGRWGEPRDIAGAAVFLSSTSADFITGATLAVDGGYSAMG